MKINSKAGFAIGLALLLLATVFIVVGGLVTENDDLTVEEPVDTELLPGQEMEIETEKRFIAAADLDEALNENPDAILLDVRNPPELEDGYIENSYNIPLPSLDAANLEATVPGIGKDDEIYIYCRSGGRSEKAMEKLIEAGYTNVTSVDGGYSTYSTLN